jgi:hypothetical protein
LDGLKELIKKTSLKKCSRSRLKTTKIKMEI